MLWFVFANIKAVDRCSWDLWDSAYNKPYIWPWEMVANSFFYKPLRQYNELEKAIILLQDVPIGPLSMQFQT